MKKFNKIAIVGVGLIGGSIGLALKRKKLAKEVVGIGHRASSIKKAIRLKTIDKGTLNLKSGVKNADIIILATPVLTIPKLIKKIKKVIKKNCIITDVGSVKSYLIKEVGKILPEDINFVGSHPMAGSEKRGVEKARKELFKNHICILTKTQRTNAQSLYTIRKLWNSLDAKVIVLSPEAHDRVVAEISHLPHMVMFTILNSINAKSLKFASTGFLDTTRIASSDAKVWKDIAIANKIKILNSISIFKNKLSFLERSIRKEDSKKLLSIFTKARKKRDRLLQ